MKKLSIILSICLNCAVLSAQTDDMALQTDSTALTSEIEAIHETPTQFASKEEGDNAFAQNDFRGAIAIYEQVIENQGISAALYFNLGNSYYKVNETAKAVINFERALLLDPSDKDILFNLELARAKTVDKVTPMPEVFLFTWYKAITNSMSEKAWGILGIILFIATMCLTAIYLFSKVLVLRKIAFISASLSLIMCLFANIFANQQKSELVNESKAIIMHPSVTVKSTPNASGTDLFILHEGIKVMIKDNSMKQWKEIELEDGHVGWVPAESLEII